MDKPPSIQTENGPKASSGHPQVNAALLDLGERLRRARVARDWTLADLGSRIGVQPHTLGRLEKGAPGASVETLALVLWHMNLLEQLAQVASPENDPEGQRLADLRAPKRARGRQSLGQAPWGDLNKL